MSLPTPIRSDTFQTLSTQSQIRPAYWTMFQAAAGQIVQDANGAFGASTVYAAAGWNATDHTFAADQWVSITIGTPPTTQFGIIVRGSGSSGGTPPANFYILRVGPSTANFQTVVNSAVPVNVLVTSGYTPASGDTLAMDVSGVSPNIRVRCWVNYATNPTPIYDNIPTVQIVAGQPGVWTYGASSGGRMRDWAAGEGFYVPSVLPPAPPTGPQGAFTVRTT